MVKEEECGPEALVINTTGPAHGHEPAHCPLAHAL
jgi:hypothetical protein